jgi:hypothetical protein
VGDLADIELGHFYLPQLLNERPQINRSYFERGIRRARAIESDGWKVQYSILIDDLGDAFSDQQKKTGFEIISHALYDFGIVNCQLAMESQFIERAPILLETLRNNYILTVDGASYLTLVSQDPFLWAQETLETPKSIKRMFLEQLKGKTDFQATPSQSQFLVPIHNPKDVFRPFGCSLLTAVWYLARLGVDGFSTSDIRPNRLINILPIKYLKSEGFAFDLLKISSAARVRKAAERIEYILL